MCGAVVVVVVTEYWVVSEVGVWFVIRYWAETVMEVRFVGGVGCVVKCLGG